MRAARSLFVYYRVGDDRERARQALAAMFTELEARTGIVGRLLMRCDDADTWMEVYSGVDDVIAFRATLDACVQRHGVDALACDGQRHLECFMPVTAAGRGGPAAVT